MMPMSAKPTATPGLPTVLPAKSAEADDPIAVAGRSLDAIDRPGPLVLAVSGGGDSVALVNAFVLASADHKGPVRPLVVATVDHGLRAGSRREAEWVADLSAGLGLPHRLLSWDGSKPSSGLQAAARAARHDLLAALAEEIGAAAVLTAHNRDDQQETMAMRAARIGVVPAVAPDQPAGFSRGLAGMAPATLVGGRTWFLRPFLSLPRAGLRAWLRARGQDWLEDPSNADLRFERVRVRARLGGDGGGETFDWQQEWGGDDVSVAAAWRERTGGMADAAAWLTAHVTLHGGLVATLPDDPVANGAPAALEAMAAIVAILGGNSHRPGRDRMSALAAFLASKPARRMTLSRVVVERCDGLIHILRERRGLPAALELAPGETLSWDGRYGITAGDVTGRILVAPASRAAVETAIAAGALADLRPSIARRALCAEPAFSISSGGLSRSPDAPWCAGGDVCAQVDRDIALFDRFLPLFDLDLACAVARLFGRSAYPPPPVSRDFLLGGAN